MRSELWQTIGVEVERVCSAVELRPHPGARPLGGGARVVAWNIQRGRRFEALLGALRDDPTLAGADVLLLSEVDFGLGRSGNRNVARELADGARHELRVRRLVPGARPTTSARRRPAVDNTLALSGTAILSRAPIGRVENVDLPELRDKFSLLGEDGSARSARCLPEIACRWAARGGGLPPRFERLAAQAGRGSSSRWSPPASGWRAIAAA